MDPNLAAVLDSTPSALASALGAIAGAVAVTYLTKKAERRAARESFGEVLREQVQATFETEHVRSAIASASARSLEQLRNDLQQQVSAFAGWRERVDRLKGAALESALALETLRLNCRSVPWLAGTSVEEITQSGHSALARLSFALRGLRGMPAIEIDSRTNTGSVSGSFEQLVGAISGYKEQIHLGNIGIGGEAKPGPGKDAEATLLRAHREWARELKEVSDAVIAFASAREPSFRDFVRGEAAAVRPRS